MIIFPDTNIFAHFQPVENWRKDYFPSPDFVVALSTPVINELEKLKYSASSMATKRRVQQIVKKISQSKDLVFNSISYQIIDIPVNSDDYYSRYSLQSDNADDRFLATVLDYISQNMQEEVAIITNDFGLKLKCRKLNLTLVEPPEEYLIEEEDASAKEIKKLLIEVNRLKNLQPDLQLEFENGEQHMQFNLEEPFNDYDLIVKEQMEAVREKHPLLMVETKGDSRFPFINFYEKTPEKVEKYNKEMNEFYEQYEFYLRRKEGFHYKEKLTIELEIFVCNTGTTPADDVDVYMHFPDGFTLLEKEGYYQEEPAPSPPDLALHGMAPLDLHLYMPRLGMPQLPNFDSFSIKKTNSYEVRDLYKSVKHHFRNRFKKLYILFDSWEEAQSFEITYELAAANMVDLQKGSLHVVLNKISEEEILAQLNGSDN